MSIKRKRIPKHSDWHWVADYTGRSLCGIHSANWISFSSLLTGMEPMCDECHEAREKSFRETCSDIRYH